MLFLVLTVSHIVERFADIKLIKINTFFSMYLFFLLNRVSQWLRWRVGEKDHLFEINHQIFIYLLLYVGKKFNILLKIC